MRFDGDVKKYTAHSRGEQKIFEILVESGLPFGYEHAFPDLVAESGRELRTDFVVYEDYDSDDIAFGIEFQGEQHYFPKFKGKKALYQQQHNDKRKKQYFIDHNIPLVVIPYWDQEFLDYDYIINKAMDQGYII